MAFLRTLPALVVSLAPMLACTFNAGGLGQTGEGPGTTGSGSGGTGTVGPTTGDPTGSPTGDPTTDEPTSVGPAGEMSATGSTGPVDPDTSATASTVDPSTTSGGPMTATGETSTSVGDESSSGGGESSTGCVTKDFFKDGDGDGFGDPKMKLTECEAPDGYVDNDGDCDDKKLKANPDAAEECDQYDNDCDDVIDEFEPMSNVDCGGCKMFLYPANSRVYYFCTGVKKWAMAKGECEKRGGTLAKDIDMDHHDWLVNLLPLESGPWWLGATSPNGDSKFTWLDGSTVPVPDPRWSDFHPLVLGKDHIVLVSNGNKDMWANDDGRWYDREDIDSQPYICEVVYTP
jgi:hypothetical protein